MNKINRKHFSHIPVDKVPKSVFDKSHSLITSFNVGQIIPIRLEEILPGDIVENERIKDLIRLSTLIDPIMDNLELDTYTFFCPNRLLWKEWVNFMGENDNDEWTEEATYKVPQITAPEGGWNVGTIADYLGLPTNISNIKVNALPFRLYAKIIHEYFRDENLQSGIAYNTDSNDVTGSNGSDYTIDTQLGGEPFIANKFHDLFTSCLPEPQKGDPVSIPLGTVADLLIGDEDPHEQTTTNASLKFLLGSTTTSNGLYNLGVNVNGSLSSGDKYGSLRAHGSAISDINQGTITGSNMYVDLSNATSATINDLRFSFALQRLLEKDARFGTRYIEMLNGHFGVKVNPGLLDMCQYLGHTHHYLDVNQVIQNSASTQTSPLGNTGAYSLSINDMKNFSHYFHEHGYLMTVAVVRYKHSYNQGIPKTFSRKDRYDFYDPTFANIGEQPIFNKEIYAQGTDVDDEVFGYNEAFVDYRYTLDHITGDMRTTSSRTLDSWHLGDHYESLPKLDEDFIKESKENVDRVIAVSSENAHQIIANFYFKTIMTRKMPVYSIPSKL